MKNRICQYLSSRIGSLKCVAAGLGLGLFTLAASAQPFAIPWSTVDGGGGVSAGGSFTLAGTIGQPDAGTAAGGNFTLQGGFWSVVAAVSTPDSPSLRITHTATNAVAVSWPYPATGFVLQYNTDLNTTNWVNAPETPSNDGAQQWITIAPPTGTRYYRLKK